MQLKPPQPISSVASESNRLQHEIADRVTRRYEEQHRTERQGRLMSLITKIVLVTLLLEVAVGGYYVLQYGLIDDLLGIESGNSQMSADENRGTLEEVEVPNVGVTQRVSPSMTDGKDLIKKDHLNIVKRFCEANKDYWKNAPDMDRPGKSGGALTFWCLAVGEGEIPVFFLNCVWLQVQL